MADPGPPVEVELTIATRPETIFRYFTDPARFARWMGQGSVLEADRRIVFTWGYEGDGQAVRWAPRPSRSPWSRRPAGPGCACAMPAGPGEAVLATGTNVARTDLDGRFRWVTGFWDVPDQAESSSRTTRSILTRRNTTNPLDPRWILHTGSERAKLCEHGGARSVRLPEARTTPGRADRP